MTSRLHYTAQPIIIALSHAATVVIPLSVHVAMLGVMMALNGVAMAFINNG